MRSFIDEFERFELGRYAAKYSFCYPNSPGQSASSTDLPVSSNFALSTCLMHENRAQSPLLLHSVPFLRKTPPFRLARTHSAAMGRPLTHLSLVLCGPYCHRRSDRSSGKRGRGGPFAHKVAMLQRVQGSTKCCSRRHVVAITLGALKQSFR
jgi:hypothetical protein